MQKTDKIHTINGHKTYRYIITLTFKHPTTCTTGMYNIAYALSKQKSFHHWIFYPEFGKQSNLHFHGTIYTTNKMYFHSFLNWWKKHVGYTYISKENNYLEWHIYCRKEIPNNPHKYKAVTPINAQEIMQRYSPFILRFS